MIYDPIYSVLKVYTVVTEIYGMRAEMYNKTAKNNVTLLIIVRYYLSGDMYCNNT